MYRKYDIKVTAKYFRVFNANGYCALGTLIFKWDGVLILPIQRNSKNKISLEN